MFRANQKINNLYSLFLTLLACISYLGSVYAQDFEPYEYKMKNVEKKVHIKDTEAKFALYLYDPKIEVEFGHRQIVTFDGLITYRTIDFIRAQASADLEKYKSFLSDTYKIKVESEIEGTEGGAYEYSNILKNRFKNVKVYIVARIVSRSSTEQMVHYQLESPDGRVEKDNIYYNFENSIWKIVEGHEDIVFDNWNFEGSKKVIEIN